jgi:hypothetical protein
MRRLRYAGDVGTVERVLGVVVVFLVLLVVALGVVVAVAAPHLRSGRQVLTPRGERVVAGARSWFGGPRR